MHKVFLTEEESSIIQGSQVIIAVLGGFPSMEDGKLISVAVRPHGDSNSRYDVSLLFDISGWLEVCGEYIGENLGLPCPDEKVLPSTKIRFSFECVENIVIDAIDMNPCGEIKFTDKPLRKSIVQDDHPSSIRRIQRPFMGFGIRCGEQFFISFFEDEVTITAEFEC